MDNFSLEAVIRAVTSNRILLVIVILLASLLIYSVLKRLVKIIIIVLIALLLYLGYLNYTGNDMDRTLQNYLKRGDEQVKEIIKKRDKLSDTIDSVNKLTK